MKADRIIFNIEASDKECAFFALYAGIRMYYERRRSRHSEDGGVSLAAAEAYCLLEQLKEKHPKEYADAEAEFNEVYVPKEESKEPKEIKNSEWPPVSCLMPVDISIGHIDSNHYIKKGDTD